MWIATLLRGTFSGGFQSRKSISVDCLLCHGIADNVLADEVSKHLALLLIIEVDEQRSFLMVHNKCCGSHPRNVAILENFNFEMSIRGRSIDIGI